VNSYGPAALPVPGVIAETIWKRYVERRFRGLCGRSIGP